jgi:hypothetical protein
MKQKHISSIFTNYKMSVFCLYKIIYDLKHERKICKGYLNSIKVKFLYYFLTIYYPKYSSTYYELFEVLSVVL